MKSIFGVIAALVLSLATPLAAAPTAAHGRLIFFGVAYDEAPPDGKNVDDFNWAPDNFAALFLSQSKDFYSEVKIATVKGKSATKDVIMRKLRDLKTVARKEDLVFFYWGTHGGSDKNDWSANLPRAGVIYGKEIKEELAKLPCPVIVAISTCGSGGFIRDGRGGGVNLPPNVAGIAACQRRKSTSNELDVSLLEALAGFADTNNDGNVTMQEALDYVPTRYEKLFRDKGGEETEPVIGHGGSWPLDRPLTRATDKRVAFVKDGWWYGGVVLARDGDKSKVRFLGYDSTTKDGGYSMPDMLIGDDATDLPGGYPPLEVEQNGSWYAAVVKSKEGNNKFKVHYIGYGDDEDEVVPIKRIRYPFPQTIEGARVRRNDK